MNPVRKLRDSFQKCVISFTLFALSFAFMPLPYCFEGAAQRASFIINGLLFWATLIAGCFFLVRASGYAKAVYRADPDTAYIRSLPPGIIRFFTNRTAAFFDVLLLASAAGTAVLLLKGNSGAEVFAVISIAVFSLIMHSLFNGRIYKLTKKGTYKERKTK